MRSPLISRPPWGHWTIGMAVGQQWRWEEVMLEIEWVNGLLRETLAGVGSRSSCRLLKISGETLR